MRCAYQVCVANDGYLVELIAATRSAVLSQDCLDGALFEDFTDAVGVQQFLCWSVYGGQKQVSIRPFPLDTPVEELV